MARVVHGLVREPARERAVADHAHDLVLLAFQVPRRGDPEGGREPGAGVAGAELIVCALGATQESRETARLAQRGEALVTPGEDLPGIRLVPDVPDDLVPRGIEAVTQRHRELDHAQPGADVATGLRHDVDQAAADLDRKSTRLNSSHGYISYAVFCLKKKKRVYQ